MKCSYEMCPNEATHTAPQMMPDGDIRWKPLCSEDQSAWWEGSDYPDGVGAPPIIAETPYVLARVQHRLLEAQESGEITEDDAAHLLSVFGMPMEQANAVLAGESKGWNT